MLINKAYQFRLYPTDEQKELINKCIGSSRFVYNYYLDKKKTMYKENKESLSLSDMKKDLKNLYIEYPWLKEVDSVCIRTSLEDLDRSFINFYNGYGYPKFKSKNYKDTYRTTCIRRSSKEKNYSNIELDLENKEIKLPKLGKVKIKGYRNKKEFNGKIFNATIKREGYKYYVSLSVEEEIEVEDRKEIKYPIGIDLGIKDLITTSDGNKYKMEEKIKRQEKRIKGLQKKLSRCKKGSNNSYKVKMKIKRAYQKIRNMRKYLIHEITTKIVKENDLIVTEDLNVKSMIMKKESKKSHLSKYISNASFYEVIRQLLYKCDWYGKVFIQVDRYFASSKKCSHCNYKNRKISDLNIREWECPCCGNINDRDINASINILRKGIEIYYKNELKLN